MKLRNIILTSILIIGISCSASLKADTFTWIPRFPAYDWDYEENKILATISANTIGSTVDKQIAIIDCLLTVWGSRGTMTITDYFYTYYNYTYLNIPTKYDYENLYEIVQEGQKKDAIF